MLSPVSSLLFIVVLLLFLAGTEYAYRVVDPNSHWPEILMITCMVFLFASVFWFVFV
jgi:hypothetical protein